MMAGDWSERTFRQREILSASSAVIGFSGSPDLPKWSMEARTSIVSAVKRFLFLTSEDPTASTYLRQSLVKVVAMEAAMKKSPSIK